MSAQDEMNRANAEAMRELEDELVRERDNADRLHAVLDTVLAAMRHDDHEDLRAVLIAPRSSQLTLGHVIDGAQALHREVVKGRPGAER